MEEEEESLKPPKDGFIYFLGMKNHMAFSPRRSCDQFFLSIKIPIWVK
jgi:hypothetical protein